MPIANTEPKSVFEYTLIVNGVFGRNRKVKSRSIHILDSEVKLVGIDLSGPAVDVLAKAQPKPGCSFRILETPVIIEHRTFDDGKVMTIRRFMCFSGIVVDSGRV